jgi:hypothetical protein
MSWARLDDGFDDHPKVLALLEYDDGAAAIGLWSLCLSWAHRNTLKRGKQPGLIPGSLPRRYLGPTARDIAELLVMVGMWETCTDCDGWMIHDFSRYLPAEKTSAVRSEAGKRGAAARWGKTGKHGNEPSSDGNLPSGSANEPDGCQDVASTAMANDGNAVANDGSRTYARRAIPNGIAPEPEPIPPSAAQKRDGGQPAPSADVTAGTLVAEWIRSCRKRPPDRVIGQVSSELKKLLNEDHDVEDIRAGLAAWALAAKHPATLASFVNETMNGHPSARASPGQSTTDTRVGTGLDLADKYRAEESQAEQRELTA